MRLGLRREAIVAVARWVYPKRNGRKCPVSLDCVNVARHPVSNVIEARSNRFASAFRVKTVPLTVRCHCYQCAFQQPLGIDYEIIALTAKQMTEGGGFLPNGWAKCPASPPAHSDRDCPSNRRVHGNNAGKCFFDHPVDQGIRKAAAHVRNRRAVMNYVAKRRRFDEQDSHCVRLGIWERAAERSTGPNPERELKCGLQVRRIIREYSLTDHTHGALSAVLITKNAAGRLNACLSSLSFCDEIVVVDSSSSDRTCEIAHRFNARVVPREWLGFGRQKQFAVEQASNDWVLCIDADECVSPQLAQSIVQALEKPTTPVYKMARCNRFLGKWLRHGEGYPDWSPRLFDRRSARWSDDSVHEKVLYAVTPGTLDGDLLHESAEDLRDYLEKQNRYTTLAAQQLFERGKSASAIQLIGSPVVRFFKFYVFRLGFLDGMPGFAHIAIGCMNSFMKYAKLTELNRSRNPAA